MKEETIFETPINFGNLPPLPKGWQVYRTVNNKYIAKSAYVESTEYASRYDARKHCFTVANQTDERFRAIYTPLLLMDVVLFMLMDGLSNSAPMVRREKMLLNKLITNMKKYIANTDRQTNGLRKQLTFMSEKYYEYIQDNLFEIERMIAECFAEKMNDNVVILSRLQLCYTLCKIIKEHNRITGAKRDSSIDGIICGLNELSDEIAKKNSSWGTIDLNTDEIVKGVNRFIKKIRGFDIQWLIGEWNEYSAINKN